jgi:hypothetical protein
VIRGLSGWDISLLNLKYRSGPPVSFGIKKQIKTAQESQDNGLKKLAKELEEIKLATECLNEAVEKEYLPLEE